MGEVVDPGQQAEGEEEEHHGQQLKEGAPGPRQNLPALEELHFQAGKACLFVEKLRSLYFMTNNFLPTIS